MSLQAISAMKGLVALNGGGGLGGGGGGGGKEGVGAKFAGALLKKKMEGVEEGGKKEVEVEENKEPEAQVEVAEVLEEAPTPPVEEEAPPIVLAVEGAPAV